MSFMFALYYIYGRSNAEEEEEECFLPVARASSAAGSV